VAWDPGSIRIIVIIIWSIITGWWVIPSVIYRRRRHPYRWGSNKNPEMAMTTIVASPGKG
jgi:heme/copper-type cytochrome/quinol oxidase subunit 2